MVVDARLRRVFISARFLLLHYGYFGIWESLAKFFIQLGVINFNCVVQSFGFGQQCRVVLGYERLLDGWKNFKLFFLRACRISWACWVPWLIATFQSHDWVPAPKKLLLYAFWIVVADSDWFSLLVTLWHNHDRVMGPSDVKHMMALFGFLWVFRLITPNFEYRRCKMLKVIPSSCLKFLANLIRKWLQSYTEIRLQFEDRDRSFPFLIT